MKLNRKIVIALDGYSSCGKSTFAKRIADTLGYVFIDSGAMYRAISLFAMQKNLVNETGINIHELKRLLPQIKIHFQREENGRVSTYLNDKNVEKIIRGVAVSQLVSEISKIKEVRLFLVKVQQELGKEKEIVMDGRDIGTVVFPEAEVKIFMTASTEVRAKRRYDELKAKGFDITIEEIRKNIEERDQSDINRKESPLKQATDAVILDNSYMNLEEQMSWFENLVKERGILAT